MKGCPRLLWERCSERESCSPTQPSVHCVGCLPPLNPLRLHSPSFHTRFGTPLSPSPCLHSKWLHQNKQVCEKSLGKAQNQRRQNAPLSYPFSTLCGQRREGQTYKSAFGPKARNLEFSSTSFRHDVLTHFIPHLVCAWRVSISDTGGFCVLWRGSSYEPRLSFHTGGFMGFSGHFRQEHSRREKTTLPTFEREGEGA